MPLLTLLQKNIMLDATTVAFLSLHYDYHPSGRDEIAGGTPPYARMPIVFGLAAAGLKTATNVPITFDIPATITIQFIGMWDALNVFQGMSPLGGDLLRPFVADIDGTFHCAHHHLAVNDNVVVWAGDAGALPGGVTEGFPIYFVVAVTATTLQLSATTGGAPILPSVDGAGFIQKILPQTFAAQSTFPVTSFVLDGTTAA